MEHSRRKGFLYRVFAGREIGVWLFVLVFPGLFVAGGAHLLLGYASHSSIVSKAAEWPRAAGEIESSIYIERTTRSPGGERILYRYEVEGQTYRSRRTIYGGVSAAEGRALARSYRVGQAVEVLVNPDDPADAMLEARMGTRSWLLPAFGLVLALGGLLIGRYVWRATAPGVEEAEREAAGLEPGEEPVAPRSPQPGFRERYSEYWTQVERDPYALIVSVITCVVFSFVLYKMIERDGMQVNHESRLAQVEGVLESAEVKWKETIWGNMPGVWGTPGRGYTTIVESWDVLPVYRYTVDREEHIGSRLDFSDTTFATEAEAQAQLDTLRMANPLTVYYDPAEPRAAVLVPRSTPNTSSPFFWIVALAALFCLIVAVRGLSHQSGPFLRRLAGVAPAGLVLFGLPLLADLGVYWWFAPAAARAEPVEGYLVETHLDEGFPAQVRLTAFYQAPGTAEQAPGGQWRFGLQHVWTEAAYDDVRFDYPEGERTFWIDPAEPSVAAMSREVGTLFGAGERLLLSFGVVVFLAALLQRRQEVKLQSGSDHSLP